MLPTADDLAALKLIESIRASFLPDAAWVDEQMRARGFELSEAPYLWVELFSQRTTDALKGGDHARAESHLRLVSSRLGEANRSNDSATARCIDVAYVEPLMWDMPDEAKRHGWRIIPQNLQQLYVDMWGEKPFMRGKR